MREREADFAFTGVIGPLGGRLSIVTELRFDVNVTEVPDPVRAQPSGTSIEKPGPRKRTKAVLSGMSPGGLFSFAFGDGALGFGLLLDPQALSPSTATARSA